MANDAVQVESTQDGQQQSSDPTSGAGDKAKQITMTAEQFDQRLDRERSKYADYDDLKAKAAKLDEIEQANKTELEKAAERAAKAEQERDAARAEALRFKVASKHGISDEDAELFLTASDEATLTRQAERLAARNDDAGKPRTPKPDGTQSKSGAEPLNGDGLELAIRRKLNLN